MLPRLHRTGRRAISLLMLLATVSMALDVSANELVRLVEQRLKAMKDVAAFKWQHQLPIENRLREELVLNKAVEQGWRYGITTDSSRHFFSVQITAAKEVQGYWFKQWQAQPNSLPKATPDLESELRPALIKLGAAITAQLARESSDLSGVNIAGLSTAMKKQLANAALAIEKYPNTLAQVRDTGVLRVGTTGDYAPFSFAPDAVEGSAQWTGIDIDLAEDLAAALGVEVRWIHTSWPSLMDDLHQGRYDIGMSGISINLQRQQTAFFSNAYQRGGKSPLIRCADSQLYTSLADIDRPGVRVIVNPGGTNHKFASANIHRASIQLHDDNRSIFDEIIAKRADVMITDQIEVTLQSAKHPQLCAAMGGKTLTYSQKGFLLPQDIVWKMYVDTWLELRSGDGSLEKLFNKHLSLHNTATQTIVGS